MDSKSMVLSSSKVLLCNEELIDSSRGEEGSGINFIRLRHPKSGSAAIYSLSKDGKVYEVLQMNDGFRSWFADEIIIKDGSLYMTSQMNAVYLILPYLNKSNNVFKFMQLDDILEDEEFPNFKDLISCDLIDLPNVADIKIDDDITYYRFNKEAALKWLEKRVHFIKRFIKEKKLILNPPSAFADFVTVPAETPQESEYLLYSFGLLSEYLEDQIADALYEHLKLNEFEGGDDLNDDSPPNKKIKMDEITSREDSFQKLKPLDSKKVEKMTIAQRKLSKIDKQGMKNISSFFTAPKK